MTKSSNKKKKAKIKQETERFRPSHFRIMAPEKIQTETIIPKHKTLSSTDTIHVENFAKQTSLHCQSTLNNGTTMTKTQLKCDPIRPIYCRPPLPSKHRFLKKLSVRFRTFCPFFFQFTHRSVLILLILLLTHHHFHHRICLCETVNILASRHPHLHDHAHQHHHHHHHHHPSNQLPKPNQFEFTSLPSSTPKSYSIQSLSTDNNINKLRQPSTIRPRHSTLLEQHDKFVRLHQNSLLSSYDSLETPTVKHFVVVQRPARPEELSQTRCVERCSCKWRSGKMWVECLDAGLNLVPRGLDSGTQVLHLSGNPLRELEARVFERADLRNLQRLHLSNCRLSEINADAFQQLSNLIELELAQNELTTLPSLALVHCPILRKLSLARNQIKVVKNSAFEKLFHLQSIDLSNNGLEMIESDAFYGLKNLKQLYLHENKLRYIEGQTMQSLPSVYELTLQHNPWWCDCGLRSFRNWMLEHRIPLSYSPNCSTPSRLAGKSWNQLDLDEFACPPDVVSVNTEVVVYEGENASIGCVMAAIPNVRIEWEWRGRTIRNMSLMTFGRQMYLIRESHSPADSGLNNNNNDLAVEEVIYNDNNLDDSDGQYFIAEDQLNDMPHLKVFKDQPNSQSLLEQKIVAGNNQLSVLQTLPMMTDTGIDSGISDGRNGEIFMSSLVNSQQLTLPVMSAPQSATINRAKRLSTTTANSKTNDDTYKRTSTLYIMNALEKDSGSYICTGSNKAGTVSANVTLTVLRRLEVTAAAYSGEEVAGIVLGALFVFLLTFVAICFVVLRSKNGLSRRQTTTTVGTGNSTNGQSNGGTTGTADGQTLLTSAAANYEKMNGAGPINGRLANGNAHHPLPNGSIVGNGTALRRNSNASTDTKDSKMSTLLVSLNSATAAAAGAASPVTTTTTTKNTHLEILSDQSPSISELALNNQNNMTIRTNRLSEQIEMSNYSSVNNENGCVDGATINSSYNITIPQRINCYVEDGHHDNDGDNNNNNHHNSTELDDDANHRHNMAIINSFYANNSNSPQQQPNRQLTSTANYGTSNDSDNCHYAQQQHSQPMPGNNNNSRITSGTYYPNHHHHLHHSNHHHSINDAGFITNGILNGMVNTDNYGANSAMYAAVLNAGQTPNVNNNHNQNNPNNSTKCNGESSSSQYSSLSLSSNGTTATAASSSSQSSQSPSAASTRPVTAKLPNYSGQFSNLPQKPYSVVQPIIGGATSMDSAIFLTNNINNNTVLPDLYRISNYLPPASNIANSRTSPSFSHPHHLLSNPLHHHYSIEDSEIELNKRHAANSVAEELQKRIAMAGTLKRNSSLDSAPSSTGQVVRFANSPTVYNYNSTGVTTDGAIVPQAPQLLNKHLNPLNRIRNGGGGVGVGGGILNPIMAAAIALNARDSPDEGLGEESDVLE